MLAIPRSKTWLLLVKSPCFAARRLPYHFGGLGASNREFQIGILLPVSKQERELGKEAVIRVPGCRNCLWTRIPVQASLESLCRTNKFLPVLEVIGIVELRAKLLAKAQRVRE